MGKTVYQTDPATGAYVGRAIAEASPKEPGVFLIPAGAVEDAPPATGENEAAVRDGNAWTVVEDHRGITVYDTATGEATQISELGPLPAGVTTVAPGERDVWDDQAGEWVPQPVPVAELAQQKRAAIHEESRRRRDALIPTYPPHERETWPQQAEEALAYQADPNADTPLLAAIATARGTDVPTMVNKVITKRAQFTAGGGAIIGAQQALEDQLETALATYDVDGDAAAARASIAAIDETDPANWP